VGSGLRHYRKAQSFIALGFFCISFLLVRVLFPNSEMGVFWDLCGLFIVGIFFVLGWVPTRDAQHGVGSVFFILFFLSFLPLFRHPCPFSVIPAKAGIQ
jgi:hypothetical protein